MEVEEGIGRRRSKEFIVFGRSEGYGFILVDICSVILFGFYGWRWLREWRGLFKVIE